MREIEPAVHVSAHAALQASAAARASSAVSVVRGAAVLRLPGSMDPSEFAASREAMLQTLAEGRHKLAVVDASAVETLDQADADVLRKLLVSVALLGSKPHLLGIQPGVAAILASQGPDFLRGVRVLRVLDEVIEFAQPAAPARPIQRPPAQRPAAKPPVAKRTKK